MKSKWEHIKELYKNKYTKPLIFFGFYFIFFTIIILTFSSSGTNPTNNDEVNNPWDNITNNYEYLYVIEGNNDIITLEGKHYGNKNVHTKKINNMIIDEVYTFYNDIYVKSDSRWESTDNYILVDELFDNRYLDILYLKSLIVDAELMNSITNFDESTTDIYKFNDINIEVVSINSKLKKISLDLPIYKVILQYKNINEVQDFVVEK